MATSCAGIGLWCPLHVVHMPVSKQITLCRHRHDQSTGMRVAPLHSNSSDPLVEVLFLVTATLDFAALGKLTLQENDASLGTHKKGYY